MSSNQSQDTASAELVRFCHDLRQYVAAGVLLSEMPGDERFGDEVAARLEMIRQLFGHVRDLIAAEMEDPGTRATRFDLVEIVDECVEMARLTRSVSLRNVLPQSSTVLADPAMMRRAIVNVLDNASRAAGPNGAILVTVGAVDDHVYVEVSDEGTGFGSIPSGSGQGLSVVDAALRRSHGRLEIASGPGPGTTVRLMLPTCVGQVLS